MTESQSDKQTNSREILEHQYNPIFCNLVTTTNEGEEDLVGLVAYALYKRSKREWAEKLQKRHSRKPNDKELTDYIEFWTDSRLDGLRKEAEGILVGYADVVINNAKPEILKDALKGKFKSNVWQSMVANFLYTIFLILTAIVLSESGIDLVAIYQKITS